jgi:hypothetical protein
MQDAKGVACISCLRAWVHASLSESFLISSCVTAVVTVTDTDTDTDTVTVMWYTVTVTVTVVFI